MVKSQSVTNLEIHQDISVILNLQPENISFTKFHHIPLKSQPCQTFWGIIHEPGSKLLVLGMGDLQPLIGNPLNGYINPYYKVDEFIPYNMEISWELIDPIAHMISGFAK